MATPSTVGPHKRKSKPAYLSSFSEQTLTPSLEEQYPPKSKNTGRQRATSADAVTTTERRLFSSGTEENTKKASAGPFVNPFRGLLKSPRVKSKHVPTVAVEKPSVPNDSMEEEQDVPPPPPTNVNCDTLNTTQLSLSLVSNQKFSFTHANSTTKVRASANSVEDAEIRSVVSAGCKTACSADTVKHSNKQKRQRQQRLHPVNNDVPEEKEARKSRLQKTKRRIRKVIHNAFGSSSEGSSSPKSLYSPKATGKENERLNEIIKAPPAPQPPSRRRSSSSKKGPSTLKSKSEKEHKVSPPTPPPPPPSSSSPNHSIDEAIRGRLDGLDSIALGPIKTSSFTSLTDPSTRDIVHKTIMASSGKDEPEMVLEGVLSNGADRWTIRITTDDLKKSDNNKTVQKDKSKREEWQSSSDYVAQKSKRIDTNSENQNDDLPTSPLSSTGTITTTSSASDISNYHSAPSVTFDDDDDDDDNDLDTFQDSVEDLGDLIDADDDNNDDKSMEDDALLLLQMWGKDEAPPPSHGSRVQPPYSTQNENIDDENNKSANLSVLLESCQCPIDIDEDAFVIDSVLRLQGVHDVIGQVIQLALFDDALIVFEKMYRGIKAQYGETHRLAGSTVHNMGVVHMWAGHYEEALFCFEEATGIRRICLKANHPDLVVSLSKKGMAHFALNQLEKAQEAFKEAISIRKMIIDRDHLELAKLHSNLGCVMYQRGQLVGALECFTAALNIQRVWLEGPIRRESIVFDTSVILINMGKVFFERNDTEMSINIFEEALLLQTTVFRRNHDIVLTTLSNLAYVKAQNDEESKAIELYSSVLKTQNANLGYNSRDAAETQGLMCMIFVQFEHFKEAHNCLTAVVKWQRENLEDTHPAVLRAMKMKEKVDLSLRFWSVDDNGSIEHRL